MDGKIFEDLVAWITQSLHRGEVLTNQKLIDIHTGNKRQIDVLIKLIDGPTKVLGIVEARDRSRPVGVDYIEQIHSKKTSVGADFAVIVSNKGYYASAVQKASQLGIRIFSLENALKFNWSLSTSTLKIVEQIFKTENAEIQFLNKASDDLIIPSGSVLAELDSNPNSLILKSKEGEPLAHLPSLMRALQEFLQPHMKMGKDNGFEVLIFFDLASKPSLYLENDKNENILIDYFRIKAFCWVENNEILPLVSHYKDSVSNKLTGEIISMELTGVKEKIDIIINNPNDIQTDRAIKIRSNRQDTFIPPVPQTQFWFTIKKLYQKHHGKFYPIPLKSKNTTTVDESRV